MEHPTAQDIDVPRVEVNPEVIKTYTTDDQYMNLLVELTKEAGSLISVVACLVQRNSEQEFEPWPRNKAILCALVVRLAKLFTGFLDSVCKDKFEFVLIYARLMYESCVNLRFLIAQDDAETYDDFVQYSLSFEARFLQKINSNISARGYRLPIEDRMVASIQRSFSASNVTVEEMAGKKYQWRHGLDQRARKVSLEDPYLGLFSLPSHAVHGNWEHLLRYNLREKGEGFLPETSWHPARPQVLGGPMILCLETGRIYLRHMFAEDTARLEDELADLKDRFKVVANLHEALLQTQSEPETGEE
jgi:hypothetical protein